VDVASELSCSVAMSDHRVVSQYHNFAVKRDGAGATRPELTKGAV